MFEVKETVCKGKAGVAYLGNQTLKSQGLNTQKRFISYITCVRQFGRKALLVEVPPP